MRVDRDGRLDAQEAEFNQVRDVVRHWPGHGLWLSSSPRGARDTYVLSVAEDGP